MQRQHGDAACGGVLFGHALGEHVQRDLAGAVQVVPARAVGDRSHQRRHDRQCPAVPERGQQRPRRARGAEGIRHHHVRHLVGSRLHRILVARAGNACVDHQRIELPILEAEIGVAVRTGDVAAHDAQRLAFQRVQRVAARTLARDDLPSARKELLHQAQPDTARCPENENRPVCHRHILHRLSLLRVPASLPLVGLAKPLVE